jgi:hypothetical protein
LKKGAKQMGQPQPIENELKERYFAICQSGNTFQLRRVAQDAEKEYRNGNSYAGVIWANCKADLGCIPEAENIFLDMMSRVPADPNNTLSRNVYLGYARLLFYKEHFGKAASIIDDFEAGIHFSSFNANWMMSTYASLGKTEKVLKIHQQIIDSEQVFVCWPAALYAFCRALSKEDFAELFFQYAEEYFGIADVNLDTLEKVMDHIAKNLIQPIIKPRLFKSEEDYLEVIYQTMHAYLTEEERWEAEAAREAIESLGDEDNKIIPFEQVVKELGLERLIQ